MCDQVRGSPWGVKRVDHNGGFHELIWENAEQEEMIKGAFEAREKFVEFL